MEIDDSKVINRFLPSSRKCSWCFWQTEGNVFAEQGPGNNRRTRQGHRTLANEFSSSKFIHDWKIVVNSLRTLILSRALMRQCSVTNK